MDKEYEISEEDVDSVIRFLKIHKPEHANRNVAIQILEQMQDGAHLLTHTNPEMLEKIYKELQTKKETRKLN